MAKVCQHSNNSKRESECRHFAWRSKRLHTAQYGFTQSISHTQVRKTKQNVYATDEEMGKGLCILVSLYSDPGNAMR